ncbi:P-type conjugative transfer protein TrbG [Caulobacter rhizosphaerae]|uniref:P-type conjugative transfer protein TrbG n=1 Tax=Caulobacter rhizosphaerae TaxID=2010972 RepID=UPI001E43B3B8|nr:P-type conjugative transfer protein TrbG [Caulobacter rhizosphaerae]
MASPGLAVLGLAAAMLAAASAPAASEPGAAPPTVARPLTSRLPSARPAPPIPAARQAQPLTDAPAVAIRAPAPRRRAVARRPRTTSGPLLTIAAANASARDWPTPGAYVNAALYYDFEPGRLYTVHTSPRFLTTITLKPGEKLIAKAAGDTVRWVLGQTLAGSGEGAQVVILVKPIRADLRTNIVLTTDQRTYLIDAVSTASSAYTSMLGWNYPQDQAQAQADERARLSAAAERETGAQVAPDVAVERLNFRYAIEARGRHGPPWTPVRVFDDGAKTYIEFPADLATKPAPPLFLLGDKDRAELVNYRQAGVYYVVDRLLDRAELRLSQRRQDIVRITRAGAGR